MTSQQQAEWHHQFRLEAQADRLCRTIGGAHDRSSDPGHRGRLHGLYRRATARWLRRSKKALNI